MLQISFNCVKLFVTFFKKKKKAEAFPRISWIPEIVEYISALNLEKVEVIVIILIIIITINNYYLSTAGIRAYGQVFSEAKIIS